jgi:hypothetical protein
MPNWRVAATMIDISASIFGRTVISLLSLYLDTRGAEARTRRSFKFKALEGSEGFQELDLRPKSLVVGIAKK